MCCEILGKNGFLSQICHCTNTFRLDSASLSVEAPSVGAKYFVQIWGRGEGNTSLSLVHKLHGASSLDEQVTSGLSSWKHD